MHSGRLTTAAGRRVSTCLHPLSDPPVLSGFHAPPTRAPPPPPPPPRPRKFAGLGWTGEERRGHPQGRRGLSSCSARSVCPLFSTAGLQLSGQEGRSAAMRHGLTARSPQRSGLGEILPLSLPERPIKPRRPTWKPSGEQLAEEQPNCVADILAPCPAKPHKSTERV